MLNQLTLIFTREQIQKLLDQSPDKVIIRTAIEEGVLIDGSKVGVLRVYADAWRIGSPVPMASVVGCPDPPCTVNG